jgi:hypothetical protein
MISTRAPHALREPAGSVPGVTGPTAGEVTAPIPERERSRRFELGAGAATVIAGVWYSSELLGRPGVPTTALLTALGLTCLGAGLIVKARGGRGAWLFTAASSLTLAIAQVLSSR